MWGLKAILVPVVVRALGGVTPKLCGSNKSQEQQIRILSRRAQSLEKLRGVKCTGSTVSQDCNGEDPSLKETQDIQQRASGEYFVFVYLCVCVSVGRLIDRYIEIYIKRESK